MENLQAWVSLPCRIWIKETAANFPSVLFGQIPIQLLPCISLHLNDVKIICLCSDSDHIDLSSLAKSAKVCLHALQRCGFVVGASQRRANSTATAWREGMYAVPSLRHTVHTVHTLGEIRGAKVKPCEA